MQPVIDNIFRVGVRVEKCWLSDFCVLLFGFSVFSFQENLLKTMLQVESTFRDLATSSSRNCLIICDRGAMDATACECFQHLVCVSCCLTGRLAAVLQSQRNSVIRYCMFCCVITVFLCFIKIAVLFSAVAYCSPFSVWNHLLISW